MVVQSIRLNLAAGEIKFTRAIPGFGQESLVAKRSP
jgi:hypothetical protein